MGVEIWSPLHRDGQVQPHFLQEDLNGRERGRGREAPAGVHAAEPSTDLPASGRQCTGMRWPGTPSGGALRSLAWEGWAQGRRGHLLSTTTVCGPKRARGFSRGWVLLWREASLIIVTMSRPQKGSQRD